MLDQNALINEMPSLRRFALRLCKKTSDADDLLQSTLLKSIEKRHLFEDGSDVFKWTSKIMFNTFVSAYRRKTKFEGFYDPEKHAEQASIEATHEVKCQVTEVGHAMEQLSDDHKEILMMVCVQGMRYQEVAENFNIPIGTVRSRVSRAREQLEAILEMPQYAPFMNDNHQTWQQARA